MATQFGNREDWGLQAVASAAGGSFSDQYFNNFAAASCYPVPCNINPQEMAESWDGSDFGHDLPAASIGNTVFSRGELQEMLKAPFYAMENPVLGDQTSPISPVCDQKETGVLKGGAEDVRGKRPQLDQSPIAAYTPKYKKRKNQQKRVVLQVTADGLSADMWAWRKYGQKPIKGSPYPRSYYRCSSSKGCLARKQVEQSCTDPGTFIITYTAEHSHSQPTRRNSLAGTVRHRFPTTTKTPSAGSSKKAKTPDAADATAASPPNSAPPVLCLPPPRMASMGEELSQIREIKQEIVTREEDQLAMRWFEGSDDSEFVASDDAVFGDDFFAGLDDLQGFISDLANFGCSSTSSGSSFLSQPEFGISEPRFPQLF